MEDLPLGRIAALVPEFAVKDLPLGRTLMMIMNNTLVIFSSVEFCLTDNVDWGIKNLTSPLVLQKF